MIEMKFSNSVSLMTDYSEQLSFIFFPLWNLHHSVARIIIYFIYFFFFFCEKLVLFLLPPPQFTNALVFTCLLIV